MVRRRLSREGEDELMKRIAQGLEEAQLESEQTPSAVISTTIVKAITGVTGIEEVIDKNEELTKSYKGLVSLYGFESAYDLYLYAMHCDSLPGVEVLEKRVKDKSKLVPVKRKVMRNGREMEMTIWEDPNKDNGSKEKEETTSEGRGGGKGSEDSKRHAREMLAKLLGGDSEINPKELAELKIATKGMSGSGEFDSTLDNYLVLRGDSESIEGVVGYSKGEGYITMEFFLSSPEAVGVASRGFFEVVKLALAEEEGVKVPDFEGGAPVFERFKLELGRDKYWSIKAKLLQETLGVN